MQIDKEHQKYWNKLSNVGENASVIDPLDKKGRKNQYIAMIRNNSIVEALREKDQCILDFGCGTGGLTEAVSQSGREVTGIDIAEDLLAMTKKRSFQSKVKFISYSKLPLPLESNKFDAVTIYAVLQYIKNKKDLTDTLIEFNRILKKNGQVVFMEQCRRKTYIEKDGYKIQRSINEYTEIIHNAGFSIHKVSIKRYGRFPLLYPIKTGLIHAKYFRLISHFELWFSKLRRLPYHTDYAETLFIIKKSK